MVAVYSLEEVAKHSTEEDCWIIVRDKVYDVSKYLDDHPGGVEIITDLAGRDSTEDYDDVGHSEEAHEILEQYLIGEVEGTAKKQAEAPPGEQQQKPPQTQQQKPPQPPGDDGASGMVTMALGAAAVIGLGLVLLRRRRVVA